MKSFVLLSAVWYFCVCSCISLQATSPADQNEEEKLRRKLSELAGNLSDKGLSSDEEVVKKPRAKGAAGFESGHGAAPYSNAQKDKELSSSSDEMPNEAQKVGLRSALVLHDWEPSCLTGLSCIKLSAVPRQGPLTCINSRTQNLLVFDLSTQLW